MLGEFQQSQDGGVSAVYFCFMGESADNPNRILLSSGAPTVSDLCSTMKVCTVHSSHSAPLVHSQALDVLTRHLNKP